MRLAGYAVFAIAIGLGAAAQAGASPLDLAYRADRPSLRTPTPGANTLLPSRLEEFEPRPQPIAVGPASTPIAVAAVSKSITVTTEGEPKLVPRPHVLDVWERVRDGFALPNVEGPLVAHWQAWYLNRPQILKAIFERSRRYVYHVVDELDKRGMPTELAFLPMVESGYNPMALSSAQAAGLWQFIPSTGKTYNLEQTELYDARRDIIASTSAALDYLQWLHEQFGDWQLALASYNWGEKAVGKAIERNKARGKPADYGRLLLPEQTRNYIPKLQALKNIVANPAAFKLELEPVPNLPYFATVSSARDIDVNVAARLADMPLQEFLALNPAHNLATISGNTRTQIVLPVDKLESFVSRLENYKQAPLREKAAKRKKGQDLIVPVTYLVKADDPLTPSLRQCSTCRRVN